MRRKEMNQGLKVYIELVVLLCIISLLVYISFHYIGMQYYPELFPVVPVFYMLAGIMLATLIAEYAGKTEAPPMKRMVVSRVVKILGSLLVLVAGILLDRLHMMSFVIVFVVYYIAYLLFETKAMLNLSKKK